MIRRMLVEFLTVTAVLVTASAVIALSGADLTVSSWFCIGGKWPVGELFPWKLLYRMDRIPAVCLALVGLAIFLGSFFRRELLRWRRPGAFLVLLLLLGPGLLVNALFKDHWGRPRPREIVQFGGSREFRQPWHKGEDGAGRSFPSGHGSAAFYMAAPYFVYRRSKIRTARIWLAAGVLFGILMSIARIAQGGHFLSDNLWAWGMVHLTAVLLVYGLKLDRAGSAASTSETGTCSI